jgi:hypothetical protein
MSRLELKIDGRDIDAGNLQPQQVMSRAATPVAQTSSSQSPCGSGTSLLRYLRYVRLSPLIVLQKSPSELCDIEN